MKNKLTLLIALSSIITIILTFGAFNKPDSHKNENITNIEEIVDEETEPPSAVVTTTSTAITTTTTTITTTTTKPLERYPEARLIWDTMISWGWTPETCAGIMGNMMAEIGGGTLDLSRWDSNDGCGYGLIQWSDKRRSLIKRRYGNYPTISEQLVYMRDEMFGTNNTPRQIDEDILSVVLNENGKQTPESVAFMFALKFERCANPYKPYRKEYARKAYNYFMNK